MAAIALFMAALAAAAPPASAQNKAAEKAEIERIVRDYLLENPEIIVEAIAAYRKKQKAAEQTAVTAALKARRKEIETDPDSPVGGNPSGDVSVVEFFDYQCGVCKRVHPLVVEMTRSDSGIRRVYKDWPILGPTSVYAARAALASRKQGKYVAFHNAMMTSRTKLSPQGVLVIAKTVGLDIARLGRDMNDREISAILKRNFDLAEALRINGTPSFVIGDTLIRGARDLDTMRKLVADARGAKAP